jgi:CspA family cold shock protein
MSVPVASDGPRRKGTVAFFHVRRGYGFISAGDGTDVFVHQSNTGSPIETGQEVEYAVRTGQKGLEAYDVLPV